MKVPCDSNSPTEIQVHHPDAVEGTFHSCSSHLHELLTFFSVDKKNYVSQETKFGALPDAMQHSICKQVHANELLSNSKK
jgi:hypothetical protein